MEGNLTEQETDVLLVLSTRNGSTFANQTIPTENRSHHTLPLMDFTFYIYLWQVVTPTVFACIIGRHLLFSIYMPLITVIDVI